jgi:ABC-type sulfate transport system substrate-binding protein
MRSTLKEVAELAKVSLATASIALNRGKVKESMRTQFENGFGDMLITYEQEMLIDKARGKLKGEVVYPRSTILSENKHQHAEWYEREWNNDDPGV